MIQVQEFAFVIMDFLGKTAVTVIELQSIKCLTIFKFGFILTDSKIDGHNIKLQEVELRGLPLEKGRSLDSNIVPTSLSDLYPANPTWITTDEMAIFSSQTDSGM